jgi:hypothetical protein
MKDYLETLKKRGQLIILCGNVLLTALNLIVVSHKLDNMNQQMILYCRTIDFTDTICAEQ